MPEELDPKVVEDVYQAVLLDFKKAARAQGRGVEDAEDVAAEAITRLLESHRKEPINNPLHWTRHTASNLWKDLGRVDRKHVSYEGIEGVSRDGGVWSIHEGEDKGENLVNRPEYEKHKTHLPRAFKEQMAGAVMEPRSPALIAEQRDFIQKIDPEWRAHMEEGFDFSSRKKLDRITRQRIQRRARALLREEPLC